MAIFDHIGIGVVMEYGTFCGFGRNGKPDFWIGQGATSYQKPEHLAPITPVHVSFAARSRAEVDVEATIHTA